MARDPSRERRYLPATVLLAAGSPVLLFAMLAASFFGSLILAADFYPRAYDWREMVMSSLASPRDNPHAYRIACLGLAFSGVLLARLTLVLGKRLHGDESTTASWAGRLLLLGGITLSLSAVIVPGHYRILGIGKTHEHLAQVSGAALCCSLVLYLKVLLSHAESPRVRLTAILLVIGPVTAFFTARLVLLFATEFFSHGDVQRIKASLWSSLALWEWVGAVCVYSFFVLLTHALRMREWSPGKRLERESFRKASS